MDTRWIEGRLNSPCSAAASTEKNVPILSLRLAVPVTSELERPFAADQDANAGHQACRRHVAAFLLDALRACGLPEADAATTADAMLEPTSPARTHGVFRLPGYVRQFRRGVFNPRPRIAVVERGPAIADRRRPGIGHVVMSYAAALAGRAGACQRRRLGGRARSNHAGAGPSTPPSRSRTTWSASTARPRACTTWRPGEAPSRCSAPTRSRWRSPPAASRR